MANEVITREDSPIAHALSPATVVAQVKLVQEIMRDVMHDKEHYGTIPGCGDKKVLLKSGAEKLCFTFQLVPSFVIEERDLNNGHREYRVVTRLHTRNGTLVGEGVGTCSTMESKYRYRGGARKCPTCGKETIIKGRAEYGGGWLCFAKKGGCGAKYPEGDKSIESQSEAKQENPDPADQYNTCLKMSKKRSIVDATITACAASDIFTQDLEELPEYETPPETAKREKVATVTGEVKQKIPTWEGDQTQEAGLIRQRLIELGGDAADTELRTTYNRMKYDAPEDVLNALAKLRARWEDIANQEPVVIEEDKK